MAGSIPDEGTRGIHSIQGDLLKKLLVSVAAGAIAALALSTPAFATNGEKGKERVEKFRNQNICGIKDVIYNPNNADNLSLSGGATAETTDKGLLLKTPEIPSKLQWKVTLASPVALNKFDSAGYLLTKTDKDEADNNDAALLSYNIHIDKDGNGTEDFTLVYEPHWQGPSPTRNVPKLWVITKTQGEFWANKADAWTGNESAGGGAENKTLAQINTLYPSAKITGYGYHQGTYNKGTNSLLSALWFDTDDSVRAAYAWTGLCNTQKVSFKATCDGTDVMLSNTVAFLNTKFTVNNHEEWVSSPKTVKVPAADAAVTVNYGKKTDTFNWVKPATGCDAPAPVVPGGTGSLPVTGISTPWLAGTGIAVLLAGAALFVMTRRKRETVAFVVE